MNVHRIEAQRWFRVLRTVEALLPQLTEPENHHEPDA